MSSIAANIVAIMPAKSNVTDIAKVDSPNETVAPMTAESKMEHDLRNVMTTFHEYEGKISYTGDLEKWRSVIGSSFRNFQIRELYVNQFGYSVVTTEVAKILVSFINNRRVLDAGAGTGYISSVLAAMGVESVTAVDTTAGACTNKKWWKKDLHFPVQVDDTVKVLEQFADSYDVVLMSWPCYDTSTGYDVAKAMTSGQVLIYQGESQSGCTANDDFFELLDAEFVEHEELNDKLWDHHYAFSGIHDRWMIYTKK